MARRTPEEPTVYPRGIYSGSLMESGSMIIDGETFYEIGPGEYSNVPGWSDQDDGPDWESSRTLFAVRDELQRLLDARSQPIDAVVKESERLGGQGLMSNGEIAIPDIPSGSQ